MYKISVITPSYNQGKYIEETIKSVISQTYNNYEYIVIDGGSTDDTIDILNKYADKIDFMICEEDGGQTEAINKGLKIASGDIFCWINSDDLLLPWALKDVVNFFLKYPKYKAVNGYTIRVNKKTEIMFNHYIPRQMSFFAKCGVWYISQQGFFWKKELLNEIGYLNERFHARMDQEYVSRILYNNHDIGIIRKALGVIRLHEETKSYINGDIWDDDNDKLIEMYGDKFRFRNNGLNYGRLVYLFYKIFNLNYLKQYCFMRLWRGVSLCDFLKKSCKK
ncbi:glycosyltransferase family 2 protein [Prosthecochloris sp. SCSIO W1103]|uniref:glycosyltransferase family 2 protein n=1 Tax=Prosthecochloris sp. SCSIO W1103 TaxID=2992244 RepID=UPI00223DBB10|nr:glycosyltransferase family 2 protein [Prosthecochloris sp. SCSIO W1103]UZJ38145.1 glycosyltransferase [Prosthecochloris sp. SCSIO W1103]